MKTLTRFLVAAFIAVCASSCEGLTDMNKNPNALLYGTVNPENMVDDLIYNTSRYLLSKTYSNQGDLIQYCVVSSSSLTYNQYNVSSSAVFNYWNNLYRWSTEANHVRERSVEVGNKATEAIGIVMESFLVQTITDMFGDIPYSDAFGTEKGNTTPKYDSQQKVYEALEADLRYANQILSESPKMENPAKDKLYNGDMAKWRKFCNSVLLRVLMRLSNRADELGIADKIKTIAGSPDYPIFESIDDAAVLYYDDAAPFVNFYGTTTDFAISYRASEFMIDNMNPVGDPRISMYFTMNGTTWKGGTSGANNSDGSMAKAAYLNETVLASFSSPFSFMRYDEVLFILAEASRNGWIGGTPSEYYKQALVASLGYWQKVSGKTITVPAKNAFLSAVAYNGSYEQLITQKFIALFGIGFEGWAEYRRTGYPVLKINPQTMNDHILPTRFMYPLQEPANSPESYAWALDRLINYYKGGDDMKTPVWWSLQAVNKGI